MACRFSVAKENHGLLLELAMMCAGEKKIQTTEGGLKSKRFCAAFRVLRYIFRKVKGENF